MEKFVYTIVLQIERKLKKVNFRIGFQMIRVTKIPSIEFLPLFHINGNIPGNVAVQQPCHV